MSQERPGRAGPPPATALREAGEWRERWSAHGQPWRTEPEIAAERQRSLAERRAVVPNLARGVFPFSGMALTRADVEWLLATHEQGCGPVVWDEEGQRTREGLDLRGADLHGVDLSGLPLARLRGGLMEHEWRTATKALLEAAAIHLEQADLSHAHLEGARLEGAHLEEARLGHAQLAQANLSFAYLEGAYLSEAELPWAMLLGAQLCGALLTDARLEGASLRNAMLAGAELSGAHLEGARLGEARLAGCRLAAGELARIRRWRPDFSAELAGADLVGAFFDAATTLDDAILGDAVYGAVSLADARLGGVNLAVVRWELVPELGDERAARRLAGEEGAKDEAAVHELRIAVRANRQLAVALQEQGMNEEAARYAYRAQVLQRSVLWRQLRRGDTHTLGPWLFSWLLNLLGGYGYRMWRILAAYGVVVSAATLAYYLLGLHAAPHLTWQVALLSSITAFHGRVFSEQFAPGSAQAWVAAGEAITGLIVESIFIAMLAQRFFGK